MALLASSILLCYTNPFNQSLFIVCLRMLPASEGQIANKIWSNSMWFWKKIHLFCSLYKEFKIILYFSERDKVKISLLIWQYLKLTYESAEQCALGYTFPICLKHYFSLYIFGGNLRLEIFIFHMKFIIKCQ